VSNQKTNSKCVSLEITMDGEGYADNTALDLRLDLENEIQDRDIGVVLDGELDDGKIMIWFVIEREDHVPIALHKFIFLLHDFAIDPQNIQFEIFDV
jgi:hypothetical protein